MPGPDPYDLLGVHKGASEDEIQQAYKRLARKWHPDRHPNDPSAADKFREIAKAYAKIKDGGGADDDFKIDAWQKNESLFGKDGLKHDVSSVVGNLFGEAPKPRGGGGRAREVPDDGGRKPNLAPGTVQVPFEAALTGGDHPLYVRLGPGPQIRRLMVTLPQGVENGTQLRIDGQVVSAVVEGHSWFKRDGNDILVDVPLTFAELCMGARVQVPTLTGRIEIKFPPGVKPGKRLRIRGKGINGGDQYCVVATRPPDMSHPGVAEAIRSLDRIDTSSPRPWDAPGSGTKAGTP